MPNAKDPDLEIPRLTAEWFRTAAKPLRRGSKRAVFIDDAVARRFATDEDIEHAPRAVLGAADHVQKGR